MATTGTSQKSASISTEGSPSQREDSTKTPACAMYGYGLEIQPGRSTDPVNPRSATIASRDARSGPSPRIMSRHGRRTITRAKARISVPKSFCGARRPTPSTTGTCPGPNQGWPSGSATSSRSSVVTIGLCTTSMRFGDTPAVLTRSSAVPRATDVTPSAHG